MGAFQRQEDLPRVRRSFLRQAHGTLQQVCGLSQLRPDPAGEPLRVDGDLSQVAGLRPANSNWGTPEIIIRNEKRMPGGGEREARSQPPFIRPKPSRR